MSAASRGVMPRIVSARATRYRHAGLVREHHRLDAIAQPELHEHARDVRLDGRLADDELSGDLSVGQPAGHELEDLELSGGELVEPLRRLSGRRDGDGELLDEPP